VVYAAAGAVLCELCDRLFPERMDYKHHFKRLHLGQFSIRCDACGRGFWKTNALRQHACYPEMRDDNVRLQWERETEALRRRSEVRASMGLDEGGGIDVVESKPTDDDAESCTGESLTADTSSPSAHDDSAVRLHSSLQTSQDVSSKSTAGLPPVAENCQSNTSTDREVDALPSHGYGTRRKRISFRQLLRCN